MRINTSLSPSDLLPQASVDAALVIDVLRATTVMTTALAAGASQITTVSGTSAAKAIADSGDPRPLLCGERGCRPIPGFQLGNSPAEYTKAVVNNKSLVLTTTNGTRAISRSETAREMFAVSFLNLSVTALAVKHFNSVHLVCAGTDGNVSGEDVLLAGALIEKLQRAVIGVELCDSSRLAIAFWRYHFPAPRANGQRTNSLPARSQLSEAFASTLGGRNLVRLGFDADLARCAAIDQAAVVVRRSTRSPAVFNNASTL